MKESKKEEFITKLETDKEILSTMPQNNEKNIVKYLMQNEETKNEYTEYKEKVIEILTKRYTEFIEISPNKQIKTLEDRIETIEKVIFLLDDEKTSYEKMKLDTSIYKIGKYYKENLENVNEQILGCIDKFSSVGIAITLNELNYSYYVQEYMKVFFEEMNKGDINSEKLKNKFEEIYWKCPDIIMQIELNFRNIYLNKQSSIDKYFEKEKNELIKKWGKTPKEIKRTYLTLKKQKIEKIEEDKKNIIDKFISGQLNIGNYEKEKIKASYLKILPKAKFEKVKEDKETIENIKKFLNSLYEYVNYNKYKFIIDDIKKYYDEKGKYEKVYTETKKKVETAEKNLKKLNKKTTQKGFFGMKKVVPQKSEAEQTKQIREIKELYKELDLNEFYQEITVYLNNNSTIYDVLNLASSYYNYLINCIISHDKNITQEEMDEQINELKEYLNSPNNTIITNIPFLEEKDMGMIIKDRYKLLGFNVEKEDIDINNVEDIMKTLEDIQMSINLEKAKIKVSTIQELLEIKKMLKIK